MIQSDARQLAGLLPPGTAGTAALIITSPPYGPSIHGQVKAQARTGGGKVTKWDNIYGTDPANLASRRSYQEDFQRAAQKASLPPQFIPHSLRHYFASPAQFGQGNPDHRGLPLARPQQHRGHPPDLRPPRPHLLGPRPHRSRRRLPGKPKAAAARKTVLNPC